MTALSPAYGGGCCRLPQVVYGRGSSGFAAGHLYRVGFDGQIWEITSARG